MPGETPFTVVNVPTSSTPVKITLPARSPAQIDLSEGSHAVYAIQWFTFAAIAGIGYPALVIQRAKKKATTSESSNAIIPPCKISGRKSLRNTFKIEIRGRGDATII